MKNWYLIDDCTSAKSQIFETLLSADRVEALNKARSEWDRLSAHDQKVRDAFYIGLADTDEDGLINYNTMTETIDIK